MNAPISSQLAQNMDQWKAVWESLACVLSASELPAEDGGTVQCDIGDFMLVGVEPGGRAHFKNNLTGNFVSLELDGSLVLQHKGHFRLGTFAHIPADSNGDTSS